MCSQNATPIPSRSNVPAPSGGAELCQSIALGVESVPSAASAAISSSLRESINSANSSGVSAGPLFAGFVGAPSVLGTSYLASVAMQIL